MSTLNTMRASLQGRSMCGTTSGYVMGCRCPACTGARRDYERARSRARKAGDYRAHIPADAVVAHLRTLGAQGMGLKTVADRAHCNPSTLSRLLYGERHHISAATAERVLAVRADLLALAGGARTPAGPTWALLNELLATGYTGGYLASEMAGRPTPAIQISKRWVDAATALKVRDMHARLRRATTKEKRAAYAALNELTEERYALWHPKTRAAIARICSRRGWPVIALADAIETPVGRKNRYGKYPPNVKTILLARTAELLVAVRDELLTEKTA